jgi:molybdopterin-guanine dinucleotide biosynthesis protein A
MNLPLNLSSPSPAGIVLCGGKSSRMGQPKALLPFGPELMLQRVVRILSCVVSPIVVVAAPDQELPSLPDNALIARDEREGRGPLQGLQAGMKELSRRGYAADLAVYATSATRCCSAFVRQVLAVIKPQDQAVVPVEDQLSPLAAAYRLAVCRDRGSPGGGSTAGIPLPASQYFEIPLEVLRATDRELYSQDATCRRLLAALGIAGFSAPSV